MKFLEGKDRQQLEFYSQSLDDTISSENEVRLIDVFVMSLPMSELGFRMDFIENGRPAYYPSDLLKLYIYGYLNRIRSSRALERECQRNIEVIWLMKGLVPDHNTISNFRRDNPKAIRQVFQATVKIAKHFDLIGGKLLAGDSTKLRAQNSKKNNFNPKKIEQHLEYIDKKLEEYSSILASEDQDSNATVEREEMEKKVKKHQMQKQKYQAMQHQLEESGDTQISTTDPESRQMITRNNITEVAYNVQTTVDAKHNIPIDYKVTNENDSKAMGSMVRRTKTILGHSDFTTLYDKGYHTGSEFSYADKQGVEVIVAVPDVASHAPDQAFDVEHFKYDKVTDSYTCPSNETLSTNGHWYNKIRGKSINKIKQYTSKVCKGCEFSSRCTNNKGGRMIERSEHADLINDNKQRHDKLKALYRRRQAIVEHPYGIIKRQWGFNYIITKQTMKRASADVGFIFTAYNLRRLLNIIGVEVFKSYLHASFALFGSFLTLFVTICQTQNLRTYIFIQKINVLQSKIYANFGKQFYNKMALNGGY
jgi:transposase